MRVVALFSATAFAVPLAAASPTGRNVYQRWWWLDNEKDSLTSKPLDALSSSSLPSGMDKDKSTLPPTSISATITSYDANPAPTDKDKETTAHAPSALPFDKPTTLPDKDRDNKDKPSITIAPGMPTSLPDKDRAQASSNDKSSSSVPDKDEFTTQIPDKGKTPTMSAETAESTVTSLQTSANEKSSLLSLPEQQPSQEAVFETGLSKLTLSLDTLGLPTPPAVTGSRSEQGLPVLQYTITILPVPSPSLGGSPSSPTVGPSSDVTVTGRGSVNDTNSLEGNPPKSAGFTSKPEIAPLGTRSSLSNAIFPSKPDTVLSTPAVTSFSGYQVVSSPLEDATPTDKELYTNVSSSIFPIWTPEMLGNAYGGGFVITPSIYVTRISSFNSSQSGVPPGYGSLPNGVTTLPANNSTVVPPVGDLTSRPDFPTEAIARPVVSAGFGSVGSQSLPSGESASPASNLTIEFPIGGAHLRTEAFIPSTTTPNVPESGKPEISDESSITLKTPGSGNSGSTLNLSNSPAQPTIVSSIGDASGTNGSPPTTAPSSTQAFKTDQSFFTSTVSPPSFGSKVLSSALRVASPSNPASGFATKLVDKDTTLAFTTSPTIPSGQQSRTAVPTPPGKDDNDQSDNDSSGVRKPISNGAQLSSPGDSIPLAGVTTGPSNMFVGPVVTETRGSDIVPSVSGSVPVLTSANSNVLGGQGGLLTSPEGSITTGERTATPGVTLPISATGGGMVVIGGSASGQIDNGLPANSPIPPGRSTNAATVQSSLTASTSDSDLSGQSPTLPAGLGETTLLPTMTNNPAEASPLGPSDGGLQADVLSSPGGSFVANETPSSTTVIPSAFHYITPIPPSLLSLFSQITAIPGGVPTPPKGSIGVSVTESSPALAIPGLLLPGETPTPAESSNGAGETLSTPPVVGSNIALPSQPSTLGSIPPALLSFLNQISAIPSSPSLGAPNVGFVNTAPIASQSLADQALSRSQTAPTPIALPSGSTAQPSGLSASITGAPFSSRLKFTGEGSPSFITPTNSAGSPAGSIVTDSPWETPAGGNTPFGGLAPSPSEAASTFASNNAGSLGQPSSSGGSAGQTGAPGANLVSRPSHSSKLAGQPLQSPANGIGKLSAPNPETPLATTTSGFLTAATGTGVSGNSNLSFTLNPTGLVPFEGSANATTITISMWLVLLLVAVVFM